MSRDRLAVRCPDGHGGSSSGDDMTISMYAASAPVFDHMLAALDGVLDKAEAHCSARKIDPAVLVGDRLYPDMFAFSRQVQIACDFAKGTCARLAGKDVPSWPDDEKTLADLKARIARTRKFVATFRPGDIDGSEGRAITMKTPREELHFKGEPYLIGFALPNFYFHLAMAYAILRHNGVELGKRDFIGGLPTS